jgi:hypothetical protein
LKFYPIVCATIIINFNQVIFLFSKIHNVKCKKIQNEKREVVEKVQNGEFKATEEPPSSSSHVSF